MEQFDFIVYNYGQVMISVLYQLEDFQLPVEPGSSRGFL